ncbi:hypothetical protein FF38_08867 [Lucilia cuprina]|uniref:Uncharacterized protein n=1 Tax=Lucilia cuprina TaxID=7375 RepID=A0A0L0BR15_LUCCU|nr:hypothetical protein FF38_08867 [Lucilia cuprina]
MSRQFRTTFTLLFRPKFLDKWLPVAQDDETMAGGAAGRAGGNSQRQGGSGFGGRTNGIQRDMISKSQKQQQYKQQPLPPPFAAVTRISEDEEAEEGAQKELNAEKKHTGNKQLAKDENEEVKGATTAVEGICHLDIKLKHKNSDFKTECQTHYKDNYSTDNNCNNEKHEYSEAKIAATCSQVLASTAKSRQSINNNNNNRKWYNTATETAATKTSTLATTTTATATAKTSTSLLNSILGNLKRHHSLNLKHNRQHHHDEQQQQNILLNHCDKSKLKTNNSSLQPSLVVAVVRQDSTIDHQIYIPHKQKMLNANCKINDDAATAIAAAYNDDDDNVNDKKYDNDVAILQHHVTTATTTTL